MRLTDRMLRATREQNKEKNKKLEIQQDPEENETGLMYMPRPALKFLNEDRGVFDNTDETSINTAKSVFDKTAVFRTGQQ